MPLCFKRLLLLFIPGLLFISCVNDKRPELNKFDIQGHRGCRGLLPENTISGMIKALEIGVKTLEMDVVISGDKKVFLSHEPFVSEEICLDQNDSLIKFGEGEKFNLYKLEYEEISNFDCGSKIHPRFPEQLKIRVRKPLLNNLIDSVRSYCSEKNRELPYFNIEIKSRPEWDEVFHPNVNQYADLVIEIIESQEISQNCFIQSFDPRVLKYIHSKYPDIKLVYLAENCLNWENQIEELGFKPEVYSPYFPLLTSSIVNSIHEKDILVIPWTANSNSEINELITIGVDGIISDYPNRVVHIVDSLTSPKAS